MKKISLVVTMCFLSFYQPIFCQKKPHKTSGHHDAERHESKSDESSNKSNTKSTNDGLSGSSTSSKHLANDVEKSMKLAAEKKQKDKIDGKLTNLQGDVAEKIVAERARKLENKDVATNVKVKTQTGREREVDVMTKDKNGNIEFIEVKSSLETNYPKDQQSKDIEIKKSGATVIDGRAKNLGIEPNQKVYPKDVKLERVDIGTAKKKEI